MTLGGGPLPGADRLVAIKQNIPIYSLGAAGWERAVVWAPLRTNPTRGRRAVSSCTNEPDRRPSTRAARTNPAPRQHAARRTRRAPGGHHRPTQRTRQPLREAGAMTTRRGLARGLTNYGDPEFALYLRKSFAKSMGLSDAMLDRPVVGICSSPAIQQLPPPRPGAGRGGESAGCWPAAPCRWRSRRSRWAGCPEPDQHVPPQPDEHGRGRDARASRSTRRCWSAAATRPCRPSSWAPRYGRLPAVQLVVGPDDDRPAAAASGWEPTAAASGRATGRGELDREEMGRDRGPARR